jgi:hypothetical protein
MSDLGPCDVCGKPGRWGRYVIGCSEHKAALQAAVESASTNTGSPKFSTEIVCGNVPCYYCVKQCDHKNIGLCGPDYPDFVGRRLRWRGNTCSHLRLDVPW